MGPFRFRAAAVLDLRRRQEEAARDLVTRAHAEQARADAALAAARGVVAGARSALTADLATGASAGRLAWHRSWIARVQRDADARLGVTRKAEEAVALTGAALRDAVQRRRVLERLRERAWRRHRHESDREHLREMDRLAGLRYYAAATEHEETDDDHQSDDQCQRSRRDRVRGLQEGPAGP